MGSGRATRVPNRQGHLPKPSVSQVVARRMRRCEGTAGSSRVPPAADGSFSVWQGPIVDRSGKEQLKVADLAEDKFLHGITFHLHEHGLRRRCARDQSNVQGHGRGG